MGDPVTRLQQVLSELDAERRRARLAEDRLGRLVEHSPAPIGLRDGAGRVVRANSAYRRTFDGGPAGGDGGPLGRTVEESRAQRAPRIWEGRVARADGSETDLVGYLFPLPGHDGETGLGEVYLDTSGQHRSRRALAESERRWHVVFDGVALGLLLLDPDGRVLDANPAMTRLTGRRRADLLGRYAGTLTTHVDAEAHTPLWADLVVGRRARYDVAARLRHADGRFVAVNLTMNAIRDGTGRMVTALAIAAPVPAGERMREDRLPTPGEAAVLRLLAGGRSIAEIARELGLTRRGVDYRLVRLRRKLRADGPGDEPATAAALVARAYVLGVLSPAAWPPTPLSDTPPGAVS